MWCMQWTHRQTQMQLISAFRCYNGAVRLLCPCRVYAWLISNACLVLTESCVTNCVCNLLIHQSQSCKPVLSPFWIGRVFVSSTEEPRPNDKHSARHRGLKQPHDNPGSPVLYSRDTPAQSQSASIMRQCNWQTYIVTSPLVCSALTFYNHADAVWRRYKHFSNEILAH